MCQFSTQCKSNIILLLCILLSHCCLTNGRYRYPLAVEKSIAIFITIPPGGEQKPKFWSIFKKLADAKDDATTMDDAVKKNFIHNPLYLSHGDGRGGALIAQKSRGEKRSEKIFRLEQQQTAIAQNQRIGEAKANTPKAGVVFAMTKLWWANLREMTDVKDGEEEQTAFQESLPQSQVDISTLNEPGKGTVLDENVKRNGSSSIAELREKVEDKNSQYQNADEDHLEIAASETESVVDHDAIVVGDVTRCETRFENRTGADEIKDSPKENDCIEATLHNSMSPIKVEGVDVHELQADEIYDANRADSNSAINGTVNLIVTKSNVETLLIEGKQSVVPNTHANPSTRTAAQFPVEEISKFVSSGHWAAIDNMLTLGLAAKYPHLRLSRQLRSVRKAAAKTTGLHGVLSGKAVTKKVPTSEHGAESLDEEDLGVIRRRIAAIDRARAGVERRAAMEEAASDGRRKGPFQRFRRRERDNDLTFRGETELLRSAKEMEARKEQILAEQLEENKRKERVLEIDRAITEGQKRIMELQSEKDTMQRRPNPLYNYSTVEEIREELVETHYVRKFCFPNEELVNEYVDELFEHGRLVKMNHTYIWKCGAGDEDDEDESIGDDLFTPSAGARKLYEVPTDYERPGRRKSRASELRRGNGGGGSWLLRQTLGQGSSLGEKIGEAVETAAYKSICSAVMASLAKSISAIHGINIMAHSDIRIFVESSPDLPPLARGGIPDKDYAQKAIVGAMREGSRKRKKKAFIRSASSLSEEAFIQRDAVVETLISHCQISAPLLKLFPLAWQRALLGNIITLIAAVVSDFCDGIQLQILGHQLSFSFKPITESDMIRHIGMAGNGFNHRRAQPDQFEAAVRATAEDVSAGLSFLDKWHERALGSGMLRAQVANLIARIVLTLADEVLSGARMDLWSAQAGGPRMVAGLEYRTTPEQQKFIRSDV